MISLPATRLAILPGLLRLQVRLVQGKGFGSWRSSRSFCRLRRPAPITQQFLLLAPRISKRTSSTSWSRMQGRRVSTCLSSCHRKGTLSTRSHQPLEKSMNPKTPNVKRNGSQSKMTNNERQTNLTISGERQEGGCE